jgi:hypothetical protein
MSDPTPCHKMEYQIFRAGSFSTWDELFADVARFATLIGKDRVLTISHSEDNNDAVVTVWYWSEMK